MMESKLEKLARENGYSDDFCKFVGILEKNLDLVSLGKDIVVGAIRQGVEESETTKIALACTGMAFFNDDPIVGSSDSQHSFVGLAEAGEEEYKKHCSESGEFRYSDFKEYKFPDIYPDVLS